VADENDPLTELAEVLRDAGARVYFDSGNNCERPCTFCGTRPAPTHKVVRIGTYPNGDPIRRPVCNQCAPVAEARQAGESPAAALPANVCAICRRPQRKEDESHDEARHCPDSPVEAREARDPVACCHIGIELRDAQQAKTKTVLARILQELTDGVALIDQGEDLPRYQTPEVTSARIDAQYRENETLRLKLTKLGEPTEDGADTLLVATRAGRLGGRPTVGHSRLPLAQIIGMIRNGETLAGLKRCWGGYPDEFWRVCIALAKELMPVESSTTLLQWTPAAPDTMPGDDTRVFFWHAAAEHPQWRLKHGYFHTWKGGQFNDDADLDGSTNIPASEVSHWAPWPENQPEEQP